MINNSTERDNALIKNILREYILGHNISGLRILITMIYPQ